MRLKFTVILKNEIRHSIIRGNLFKQNLHCKHPFVDKMINTSMLMMFAFLKSFCDILFKNFVNNISSYHLILLMYFHSMSSK